MITVPGTINVRSIPGRYGDFNVGTLECSIGSFTVKDATIEEFDEGSYDGDFVIDTIKPNSYFSGGRLVVEVRAYLQSILLKHDTVAQPAVPESLEQDPLEAEQPELANKASAIPQQDSSDDSHLSELYAELWPLATIVKLDPSIDRAKFRQQKTYLKENGYRFVATKQHWIKE